ncbi:MAG: hypothetical protein FWD40_06485 [Treponema sp.]|nr:hypothetical protein [Treponema sp.]
MHKAAACLILILLLGMPVLLVAQDSNEPEIDIDWDIYTADLYVRGDQTFIISLGVVFPTIFINNGSKIAHQITPPVGGIGLLNYNYYLNSRFYIGAELGGFFLPTLAKNTVFIIPLGASAGTQFLAGRFEFPLFLTVGMAWQNYLNLGYYGLYAKAGGSAYFRATSEWSFGLTTFWSWFPQWTDDPAKNVHGNFLGLTLSARYHF